MSANQNNQLLKSDSGFTMKVVRDEQLEQFFQRHPEMAQRREDHRKRVKEINARHEAKKLGIKIPPVKRNLKIVYREKMKNMTFKDWSALKVRLKFLRDRLLIDIRSSDFWDNAPASYKACVSKVDIKRANKDLELLIKAVDVLLNYDGNHLSTREFIRGYFVPSCDQVKGYAGSSYEDNYDQLSIPQPIADSPEEAKVLAARQLAYYKNLGEFKRSGLFYNRA